MRKTISAIAALGAAVLLLAGCSAGNDSGSGGDVVTLDYWNFTASTMPMEEKLIAEFEKQNPDIKINLQELALDNYQNNLQVGARAGTNPDVFQAIPEWLYDFRSFDVIKELSKETAAAFEEHFAPAGMQLVTIDGAVYGAPFRFGQSAVFVNNAMFEAAGVEIPAEWTWEEFKAAAAAVTDSGAGAGFAVPVSSAQADLGSSWDWLTHFFSYGGSLFDGDAPAINSTAAVDSLTNYISFYTDGISPDAQLNWVTNDVVQAFGNGEVASFINGPWYISTIESSFPNLDFSVVPAPTGTEYGSAAGGTFIGISAQTEHQEQAERFITFMTSTDVLSRWALDGQFIPPVPAIVEAPEFQTPELAPFTRYISEPGVQIPGLTPSNTALMTSLQTAIEEAMAGRLSPKEALDRAASEWTKILADAK